MKVPNDEWQLTTMNKDYMLCDTYPSQLFVPNSADKTVLLGSSRFRSKGRLPALTYLHPNKASISRCSQPLSGFSARCMEDEQMLQEVRKTNPNSSILYVVDTRPRVSSIKLVKLIINNTELLIQYSNLIGLKLCLSFFWKRKNEESFFFFFFKKIIHQIKWKIF